jgi:hypothetical protein
MRRRFFGDEASTRWSRNVLESGVKNYRHVDADIRDSSAMGDVFARYGGDIAIVIHTPRSRRTIGPRAVRSPISPSMPTARSISC